MVIFLYIKPVLISLEKAHLEGGSNEAVISHHNQALIFMFNLNKMNS